MAFKKQIQCASCKFTNQLGEARCLICKEPLPQVAPPAETPAAKPGLGGDATKPRGEARRVDARSTVVSRRVELGDDPQDTQRRDGPVSTERARPTTRITAAQMLDRTSVLAWLCCDPLPPIPLGPKPLLTIGRHADCDLVLPHKEVSRRHAVVKIRAGSMVLEDEGSSNGCYVNGARASGQVLKVGDVIAVGPYEVEIRAKDAVDKPPGPEDTAPGLELTTVSRLSPLAAMTGKLDEVPLMELLQGIEFNKKTGTLKVESRRGLGSLVVNQGVPMFARWGDALTDDAAVLEMLTLGEGRFTFAGSVEPGERTMRTTLTGLLLEASRRIDEAPQVAAGGEPGDAAGDGGDAEASGDGPAGWTLEDP